MVTAEWLRHDLVPLCLPAEGGRGYPPYPAYLGHPFSQIGQLTAEVASLKWHRITELIQRLDGKRDKGLTEMRQEMGPKGAGAGQHHDHNRREGEPHGHPLRPHADGRYAGSKRAR